jgi:hypothetical protein
MIQNSKIEEGKYYSHPGFMDVVIKAVYVGEGRITVRWYNVSGWKRKFVLDHEEFTQEDFERSPYWMDLGTIVDELPTEYL